LNREKLKFIMVLKNQDTNFKTANQVDSRLSTENITIKYDDKVISNNLSVKIQQGSFTAIIGANACGKSTLLRALSKLIKPTKGRVILDGEKITTYKSKEVAQKIGLLPQSSTAPDGITVANLIAHGRYPYQSFINQWDETDEKIVLSAMQ